MLHCPGIESIESSISFGVRIGSRLIGVLGEKGNDFGEIKLMIVCI